MANRISENQNFINLTNNSRIAREQVVKYSEEISSGFKVVTPGDSNSSGTIAQIRNTIDRVNGYNNRTANATALLGYQEDIMKQANDTLVRAKEIAAQSANETLDPSLRNQMAQEALALRDHMVDLANSTYQGKYIWNGAQDGTPPFSPASYTTGTGGFAQRYTFTPTAATQAVRTVEVADTVSVTINSSGDDIFQNAISGLERLSRSLAGYSSNPATGPTNATGGTYTFPTDYNQQTLDIKAAMDLVDQARTDDIGIERVSIGSRQARLDTAKSILDITKSSAQTALDNLQNADLAESATNLSKAQTALEASLTVTGRILKQSILDYL